PPVPLIISHVTTTVVLPARLASCDSARLSSPLRLTAATVRSRLWALARDSVFDLVRSVDRMSIRSLLVRLRQALQPDATWTINWISGAPTPFADMRVNPHQRHYPLGSKPL